MEVFRQLWRVVTEPFLRHSDTPGDGESRRAAMNDHECSDPSHSHDLSTDDTMTISLFSSISLSSVRALNESVPSSIRGVFKSHEKRSTLHPSCSSNAGDPELLVFVPFDYPVHVRSISVLGPSSSSSVGSSPRSVKLWTNRLDLDFDEAREDEHPAQRVELLDPSSHEHGDGTVDYPLRAAKFQNVTSLTLFFPDSFEGEQTTLLYIGFKGVATKVRREAVECVYESRSNVEDHKIGEEMKAKMDGL